MISIQNVSKHFGTKELFNEINLRVDSGDRLGIIGANGTGKTTLARIITGEESYDGGKVSRTKTWRIGYLAQEVERIRDQRLREFVESGRPELVKARVRLEELEQAVHEKDDRQTQMAYAEALAKFEEIGGYSVEAEVERILAGLGFKPGQTNQHIKTMSGGWIMRAALARLLFQEPDLLILDEPTNHLDLPALTWLEDFLNDWKGAFMVISHDRTFLNNMVNRIVELFDKQLIEYTGNYDKYVVEKQQRQEILEATLKNQEQKIAQVERFIEKNIGQPKRARQAGSRKKMLELLEAQLVELPKREKKVKFKFPQPERGGTPAVRLENIDKSYGEKVVYKGMNFEARRGEKIALVGPNGSGKSTLLKILADVLPFEGGEKKLGTNTSVHYFAQHQLDALNPANTPLSEMSELPGWDKISWIRSLLGALLLGPKEVETAIADLSGGEKAKVALAKMLVNPANLILMDEPTNHLDPSAREVLEDALREYQGTLIFISHDRTFINNIASKVVEIVDGQIAVYPGNYDDYTNARQRGINPSNFELLTEKASPASVGKQNEVPEKRKESRDEAKERKRKEAELRTERKKVTNKLKSEVRGLEARISATEQKLEEVHGRYSEPDLAPAEFEELGKESRAVSQYLKKLYAEWEEASMALEKAEEEFDKRQKEFAG